MEIYTEIPAQREEEYVRPGENRYRMDRQPYLHLFAMTLPAARPRPVTDVILARILRAFLDSTTQMERADLSAG